ncbi:hypothetical protein ACFU5Z_33060 [Streptomyces sp. NPDC057521]|uniref:hypothetical protein n=1 Tax=Streptomyces sp. NPDC057521 TaxID=3346156 RepID=UPI0036B5D098
MRPLPGRRGWQPGVVLGAGQIQEGGGKSDLDARHFIHLDGLLSGRGAAMGWYTAAAASAQAPISVVRAAISLA